MIFKPTNFITKRKSFPPNPQIKGKMREARIDRKMNMKRTKAVNWQENEQIINELEQTKERRNKET